LQQQAARLQHEGKAAFFLPLDQITSQESVQAVLNDQARRFDQRLLASEVGYVFLDAVDEARLISPAALQAALRAIRDALRPHLHRLSCFISSRITDWSVPSVRASIEQMLLKSMEDAVAPPALTIVDHTSTLEITGRTPTASLQVEVYCLDPLSEGDAKYRSCTCSVRVIP